MLAATEHALSAAISDRARCIGEVAVVTDGNRFVLTHRDDVGKAGLATSQSPADAIQLAMFDDAGRFRPLKTEPNLRHGWRLELASLGKAASALDYFYPGRLAAFAAWTSNRLTTTSLRESLNRQSGMYRVAAKISDDQIDSVVGRFCRSSDGCLRTILWKRDNKDAAASTKLPPEKFQPAYDQLGRNEHCIPLLCQEACNLLVNECRKIVKSEPAE